MPTPPTSRSKAVSAKLLRAALAAAWENTAPKRLAARLTGRER